MILHSPKWLRKQHLLCSHFWLSPQLVYLFFFFWLIVTIGLLSLVSGTWTSDQIKRKIYEVHLIICPKNSPIQFVSEYPKNGRWNYHSGKFIMLIYFNQPIKLQVSNFDPQTSISYDCLVKIKELLVTSIMYYNNNNNNIN